MIPPRWERTTPPQVGTRSQTVICLSSRWPRGPVLARAQNLDNGVQFSEDANKRPRCQQMAEQLNSLVKIIGTKPWGADT